MHNCFNTTMRLYLCPRAKLPSQSVCNRLEALIYYPSELILAEAALVTLQNDYYQKAAITVLNNTISTGGIVNAGEKLDSCNQNVYDDVGRKLEIGYILSKYS
ncbi:2647_t:CDS:2 [Entrophospora sp. SA101]|nr:3146_t:CDS:2 [Entrophospora sp. SA101]CAJ0922869.1 2647_t:CDS:2 [Entrophospora sp. SA101]